MVALTLPIATTAQAQPAAVYGGPGGRYFEFSCGPGKILVGLRASAGVLIDNAQAICARIGSDGGFTEAAAQGPMFGNSRPQDQHIECPGGYAVTELRIQMNDDHPHIGAIELRCTELANRGDGGTATLGMRGSGNLKGYSSPQLLTGSSEGFEAGWSSCSSGYATGIRGRAGEHLSAVGLLCGPKPAFVADETPRTLGKRKKSSIVGKYPGTATTTSSIPQAPKTLGKRKRPGTWPAPQQTGTVGASLDSDGFIGAPPPEPASAPQAPVPSSMIGGVYATTVAITDSRCLIQEDLRGSWQGQVDVSPQPGVVIPLDQYSGFFGGPVTLNVDGLRLSQSTKIPVKFGPLTGPAPAKFDGAFTEDGSRFDVQFQAGTDLCRVSGTISGSRN